MYIYMNYLQKMVWIWIAIVYILTVTNGFQASVGDTDEYSII